MKMFLRVIFTFFIFIVVPDKSLLAQDIHFLQYNASPQNLNPAQTGLFKGDWRLVGNFRNQWKSTTANFNTFSFSADTKFRLSEKLLEKKVFKSAAPTIGLLLNTDKAGSSKLKTTQVYISLGYIKKLNKTVPQYISIGIQPGISTLSFDENEITTDSQFNGEVYDPSLSNGESFPRLSYSRFDIGAGVSYVIEKNSRKTLNIGASVFHLNKPQQSFFKERGTNLSSKMNITAEVQYQMFPMFDILPSFLYQKQGDALETVIGSSVKYHLTPIEGQRTAVSVGVFTRAKDAFILTVGMEYKSFDVGLSYDINISELTVATSKKGAFEVSIIYIFERDIPFNVKKRYCPIYM